MLGDLESVARIHRFGSGLAHPSVTSKPLVRAAARCAVRGTEKDWHGPELRAVHEYARRNRFARVRATDHELAHHPLRISEAGKVYGRDDSRVKLLFSRCVAALRTAQSCIALHHSLGHCDQARCAWRRTASMTTTPEISRAVRPAP